MAEAETLGRLLKGLRDQVGDGWSQPDLADAAGVPLPSLRNWEQDRRRPDLASAYRLAQALGVSLDVLGAAAAREDDAGAAEPKPAKKEARKPATKKGGKR